MNISLLLLKTGEYLISQVEELEYEPKVHLTSPYIISGKTKRLLSIWPLHTDDEHILLNSETLLTVCVPTKDLRADYLKKIGVTEEELVERAKPVMLNEENQDWVDDVDEYEPRYVEQPV